MPLYNKLPDYLHEVDVIVSGGEHLLFEPLSPSFPAYYWLLQVEVQDAWLQPG